MRSTDAVRPPLLLLPGLLNDADLWHDQVEALSAVAECRVGDIASDRTLADAATRLLAQAPPRFALAGFSLGGFVAQEMLRQAPHRIARLALLDTSSRADTPEQTARRRAADHAVRLPGHFNGFGERMAERFMAPSHHRDPAMVGRVRAMTARLGADVFLRQNGWRRADGRDVLRAFTAPALVLCGEEDRVTPVELHREMAALMPQSVLVVVPDCGHLAPIEQPQRVAGALREWLARD